MPKTVEYYLSRGFDRAAAEYYAAGRRTIVAVRPNEDFSLTLSFDNGERRQLDVKPMLEEGTVFAPLRNPANFCRVYLDAQHCVAWDIDPAVDSAKVWNNKIDLCPDSCYMDSVPENPVIGRSWEEVRAELYTPEEIAESDQRVALIGEDHFRGSTKMKE